MSFSDEESKTFRMKTGSVKFVVERIGIVMDLEKISTLEIKYLTGKY
ncbi:MAG: hypothetical protein U0W24_15210 [Bacteroidales bacterium]